MGAMYQCAPTQVLKLLSCNADTCDVQIYAGVAPRPGLVSCAGKFEGRCSNTSGPGNMTIIFRSRKATLADPSGSGGEVMECWTGGGKIYIHKPGDPSSEDMPLDINNDGTRDTPFGEIKKKGN
jgi:hypothetical protein